MDAHTKKLVALSDKKGFLREKNLFAIWCARQAIQLLVDNKSINAMQLVEDFYYGGATAEECDLASHAAYDAFLAAQECIIDLSKKHDSGFADDGSDDVLDAENYVSLFSQCCAAGAAYSACICDIVAAARMAVDAISIKASAEMVKDRSISDSKAMQLAKSLKEASAIRAIEFQRDELARLMHCIKNNQLYEITLSK